jgi:hypothetical protein
VLPGVDHSMYVSHSGSWREERLLTTLDVDAFSLLDAWLVSQHIIGRPDNGASTTTH